MRNCLLAAIMFLGSLTAFSQQEYFVYLQTDNHQAFYVRLNNKIYSSTASGYMVMPRLSDSTHAIAIGFPQNAFPEQEFALPQNHKDAGYLLKNFGDKGWGLFNLQTMAVIMNNNQREKKSPEVTGEKKNDAFSMMLSNAVNDTAILYASYKPKPAVTSIAAVKEDKKTDTPDIASNKDAAKQTITIQQDHVFAPDTTSSIKKHLTKKDSAAIAKNGKPVKTVTPLPKNNTTQKNVTVNQPKKPAIKKDTLPALTAALKSDSNAVAVKEKEKEPTRIVVIPSDVTKAAELLTDTSYIAVFIDRALENNDTIRISIPFNELYTKATKNPYLRKPDSVRHEPPVTTKKPAAVNDNGIAVHADKEKTTGDDSVKNNTARGEVKKQQPVITPVTAQIKDSTEIVKDNASEQRAVKKDSVIATTTTSNVAKSTDTSQRNMGMKPILINSDCKATAWDSDIDKLRVKMLAANTDDDKIEVAKKLYKQKCLTVKQVRALSELFTTDQSKYKWLDATYPFTSNSYYFPELEDLLKDDYFRNRFKAMIRK